MFGLGDFWKNHPRNFRKFWNCPSKLRVIYALMHNLSQITLPNMWLLVPIWVASQKTITCSKSVIEILGKSVKYIQS